MALRGGWEGLYLSYVGGGGEGNPSAPSTSSIYIPEHNAEITRNVLRVSTDGERASQTIA